MGQSTKLTDSAISCARIQKQMQSNKFLCLFNTSNNCTVEKHMVFFIAAFYIFKHDLPKEITKISIIASILFDVTATIKCEPIQLKMIAFDFGLSRLQVQTL